MPAFAFSGRPGRLFPRISSHRWLQSSVQTDGCFSVASTAVSGCRGPYPTDWVWLGVEVYETLIFASAIRRIFG